MKKTIYILGSIFAYLLWVNIIMFLYDIPIGSDYPILRARFGTIMHHSSDSLGEIGGAINDPNAVAHTYCYYPKVEAKSELVIKRKNDDDCSLWYGEIVFYEAGHVSEIEKYWWSEKQHIKDCEGCDDLKFVAEKI